MKPRIWPIVLASGIGLAILLWLGVWQVQRLAWKNGLIAEIDKRLAEEPRRMVDPEQVDNKPAADGTIFKVKLTGHFLPIHLRKISVLNGGPGWEILQVFEPISGGRFLVSRGVAGETQKVEAPGNAMTIVGLVKYHLSKRGYFDPENDPLHNRWYWWDGPAMEQAAGLPVFTHNSGALVVQLLPGSPGTEGFHVNPPKADLRNNHLGYAITWFGLAAALLVMTGVFVGRIVRTG